MENKKNNKILYLPLILIWIKDNLFSLLSLKRLLKWTFNLILFIFVIVLLLIYSSSFQTIVAKFLTFYLSKDIGLEVKIDKVSLDIFHKLYLQNFLVKDHKNDTLIYLNQLDVDIQYSSIFHKKLIIEKITLNNPTIYIIRHKGDKFFNYNKLIEYFSSSDTTRKKTSTNFDFQLKSIELKNAHIIYKDEKYNTKVSPQINYDYLNLYSVNLILDKIQPKKDTLYFQIQNFSAKEQSGFAVKKLKGNTRITSQSMFFKDLNLQTSKSVVVGNVLFSYPSFDDFIDNIEKNMTIDAELYYPTKIYMAELFHFAKELKGWGNYVMLSGKVKGKVGDLTITQGKIDYENTQIIGDIRIIGLPDIEKTFFDIRSDDLITSAQSIEKIPLYPFEKKEYIRLPKQFKNVDIVTFKGDIKGYYHQFKAKGILITKIGDIQLNTLLSIDSITNDLKYNGNFKFKDFHFGKFFQQKNIGTLTADVWLNGNGTFFKTMKTSVQAKIQKFVFNHYTYKDISIDVNLDKSKLNGNIISKDENAQFNFSGLIDFDNKIPDMNFVASIDKLNLTQLHFVNDPHNGYLKGTLQFKLLGEDIDDISGDISMNNVQYITNEKVYFFFHPKIKLLQNNDKHKLFYLHSEFIDLDIEGKFSLSDANYYVNHFMKTYYPSFIKKKYNFKEISKDTFQLLFRIKNFEPLSDLLTENKLFIQPNTELKINYHPKDLELVAQFHSELMAYGKYKFSNITMTTNSNDRQLNAIMKIKKITLSDSLYLNDVSICSHSFDNKARTNIEWKTTRDTIQYTYNGQIGVSTIFYPHAIYIIPDAFEIPVGKDKWLANELNPIIIDTAENINFFPMRLVRQNQSINISGSLHNQEKDELKIEFKNFELHQLNPLLVDNSIQLKGTLNGQLVWHQTLKKSIISSNIKIKDLYLNKHFIGNTKLYTAYQPLNKSLYLQGNLSYDYSNILQTETNTQLKYLDFEGIYYTAKKDSSLDIELEAKPFNLAILNPFLKDIMTIDYAFLYGKGKIQGTPEKVLISGEFKITDSKIKTDYLNTYHKIVGKIDVMPDQIRFDEMDIYNYDNNKEKVGTLNGNIFHNNFSNLRLDFDINSKNLLVLNTNPLINKDYYGKIYASGTIGIYGFLNNINIEANLTPKKYSKFTLSFSHPEEVGENSFVKFINPKDTVIKETKHSDVSGLQMKFIFNATPDLETEVIFNEKTGDAVKARGDGVIEMVINSYGKFEINGQYTVRSGSYLFTLENIINKKFDLQQGSRINFIGNPYNTLIDITANYVQKASLAPLFPYDSTGTYKRRYPVTAQLILKGKMVNPDILFNIDVPQVDATTKSKIQLLLSDENELNRQFFSLLLLKSFVIPLQYANAGGVTAGNALAANSSEMLSNRLSSALKGLSDFVDIGVNYNPGSQTSSEQMELTMSKQMFNNRLSIDGSFGVNNNQTQHTSQIIGDVNIEYKLNESGTYILKAFNRTNNNTQMTISGGPYTQGIGIGYKYEFNSLFRRKDKKSIKTIDK